MNAVDANVLVYFIDFDEPEKRATAIDLLDRLSAENDTVLAWQVAVEFLSCLRRWENKRKIDPSETIEHLNRLESMFSIVLPTQSVLRLSLDLRSRPKISRTVGCTHHVFFSIKTEVPSNICTSYFWTAP